MRRRVGFATSVRLGLSAMEEVALLGGTLDLVLTLPDEVAPQKSGRVYVDAFCENHSFPLLKCRSINSAGAVAAIKQADLDWLFVLESQIVGDEVLNAPRRGCLGMHPAPLPQGRGRAVIPWAILKQLPETGLTLFKLDAGVDTGPIIEQILIPVAPDETATTLYAKVEQAHRSLIRLVWEDLMNDTVEFRYQDDSLATAWPGRRPEDGRILSTMTVEEIERLVRAVTHPYPGARWRQGDADVIVWSGHVRRPNESVAEEREIRGSNGVYIIDDWIGIE